MANNLKMTAEHLEQLRTAITAIPELRQLAEGYGKSDLRPGLFRWDMLWKSKLRAGDSIGMKTGWPVYDYLNDDHIDSALRQIMRELDLTWAAQQ